MIETNGTTEKHFGATYCTDADSFGEITSVFEVDPDWTGYRFHGYCTPSDEEVEAFYSAKK
ncbi:MAG: hypothetical protein WC829_03115 [Hyphomicrobium sp.]|jgi:hypothetical protein